MNLLPSHLAHLRGSGLSDETIGAAGAYSLTDPAKAGTLLNWSGPGPAPAIAFPYFDIGQNDIGAVLRPDNPRLGDRGKPVKYEWPKGLPTRLYFPRSPAVHADLWQDTRQPLLLVEGIKKVWAAIQAGGLGISAQGTWVWHDVEHHDRTGKWRLHADFGDVPQRGRTFFIAFDGGDTTNNPPVIMAEAQLGRMLIEAGADVRLLRIPTQDGRKVGLDDFLVQQSDPRTAVAALLLAALPADPIERSRRAVDAADPVAAVQQLVGDFSFAASLHAAPIAVLEGAAQILKRRGISKTALKEAVESYKDLFKSTSSSAHRSSPTAASVPIVARASGADPRPKITITTHEREVIDSALAAVAAHPDLYHRGGVLVHTIRDEGTLAGVIRPAGAPRVVILPMPRLREMLADAALWTRANNRTGHLEDAHPPEWAVRGVDARGTWPMLRPLEAVVETPVLRPDGSVVDRPGYDADTGLLYIPNGSFPPVAKRPSPAEARAAVARLRDVVSDFPFATEAHGAAWLSSVLTPFARFCFRGPSPLNLVDANTRGVGKGLLVDVTGEIVTGRPMARMAHIDDDAEMDKRVLSIAIAGDSLVLIDNINGTLGGSTLDAALTASEWSGRLLGSNRMLRVPLSVTWWATGNNVILAGDTPRRCLHIRLESPEERPERRSGFQHADLLPWVRGQRGELVAAAVTILRAYIVAGRPDMGLPSWGSFESWSSLVRHALVWAGQPDPGGTREELQSESDRDALALKDLIAGWAEVAAVFSGGACTVSQALTELALPGNADKYGALRSALAEMVPTDTGHLPNGFRIGKLLTRFKGRVVGGRALIRSTGRTTNGIAWSVRGVVATGSAGSPA